MQKQALTRIGIRARWRSTLDPKIEEKRLSNSFFVEGYETFRFTTTRSTIKNSDNWLLKYLVASN